MSEIYRIFREQKAALRGVVRRHLAPGADAEDMLQDAFLRAFAAELKRDLENPKAFLFQVARNTALADLRRRRASPIDGSVDFDDVALSTRGPEADGAEHLDARRKLRLFATAVADLPPKCRQAFLLRRVEGLSYKQIANRMDISVSAVEKHVIKGLVRCHRFLIDAGYEPNEFGSGLDAGLAPVRESAQRESGSTSTDD